MSRIDLSSGPASVMSCTIVGDLDGSSTEALEAALDRSLGQSASRLILDFTGAGYINSTGIGALVGVLKRARDNDLALEAVGLSDHYRHIFEITRLSEFIEIAGSDEGRVQG